MDTGLFLEPMVMGYRTVKEFLRYV